MTNNPELITEMIAKQRETRSVKYHLEKNDLSRICKNIDSSIFYSNECVLWKKFLTKSNDDKSCYINFYLRRSKFALHRLLYINFVGDLKSNQYLKYTCENPGQCCNISHFYKVKENDDDDEEVEVEDDEYDEELIVDIPKDDNIIIHATSSPNAARNKLILIFND
jgi:hypothetical protein